MPVLFAAGIYAQGAGGEAEAGCAYPGLFVRAWVATSVELRALLLAGKLDVMVYAGTDAEALLATHTLFSEPLHVIGAGGSEALCLGSPADLPLILTSRPNSVRTLIDAWAAWNEFALNVVMEVNDVSLTLKLVRDGVGFTILPGSAIPRQDQAHFSERAIDELELSWMVAYSREKPLSMADKCLIEVIREVISPTPRSRVA